MSAVSTWLESFDCALQRRDVEAVVELFDEPECFWRDIVAFTWNIYTAENREEVRNMLHRTLHHTAPHGWALKKELPPEEGGSIQQAFISFETRSGRCTGHVRIKGSKCWTLLTAMDELKGHEENAGPSREKGVEHGAFKDRHTWLHVRTQEIHELGRTPGRQPFCLIVGGGQAGIALGARLRRLKVPTIIVDRNARAGDSWRNRYASLYLQDPVWCHDLPYIPFPDHWPVFPAKDKLGDWLEAYTEVMELVYWTSTECKSATFDEEKARWNVVVETMGKMQEILHPTELVLAVGVSGSPQVPIFPGEEKFVGEKMHSSEYFDGTAWRGKQCLIVGSNNSAHDISMDLWEHGAASVTMLQRSSTHVLRSDTFLAEEMGFFKQDSPFSVDDIDLLAASIPMKLFSRMRIPMYQRIAQIDAEFYAGLAQAGFVNDFGDDGSGLFSMYFRRASGFYIDVGASELVMKGEIKLKTGVEVREVKERSVVLSDGSQVDADMMVCATGYGPMSRLVSEICGEEVGAKVGKCWGLGSDTKLDPGPWERELRNMWKPTQQPHLWIHGGSLQLCRFFSLYLALQIKARMEAIPTPVYALAPVHHSV